MRALSPPLLAHARSSAFAPLLSSAFAWTPGILATDSGIGETDTPGIRATGSSSACHAAIPVETQ